MPFTSFTDESIGPLLTDLKIQSRVVAVYGNLYPPPRHSPPASGRPAPGRPLILNGILSTPLSFPVPAVIRNGHRFGVSPARSTGYRSRHHNPGVSCPVSLGGHRLRSPGGRAGAGSVHPFRAVPARSRPRLGHDPTITRPRIGHGIPGHRIAPPRARDPSGYRVAPAPREKPATGPL